MKKLLLMLLAIITMFSLTGCDWGKVNEDVNVHIRNNDSIIVKVEEDYKEVKYLEARGQSQYNSYTVFNWNNTSYSSKGYYDSNTKMFKEVSEESTKYYDFSNCLYVIFEYL